MDLIPWVSWATVIGLAAGPVTESRGSIIYGLAAGLNPTAVLLISIAANVAIIPMLFFAFRKARFMEFVHKIAGKRIHKKIERWRKRFELYEELALIPFVAIPVPGTGAWTACVVAEILDLDRIRSSVVIALGVVAAAAIVFASTSSALAFL